MDNVLIYPLGTTEASCYAARFLTQKGYFIIDHPAPEVTHLLMDVPSFLSDGTLRSGRDLPKLLSMLPPDLTVIGGKLTHPVLQNHRTLDLLTDEYYLAQNAAITADCAIQTAMPLLKTTLTDSPALIIGWGRIGKCLAQMLQSLGCRVTIAARKESDRAMILAFGYSALGISEIPGNLHRFRILFNTVPVLLLERAVLAQAKHCIKIDLASHPGIDCEDVHWARGLPGLLAPESSGRLIADTIDRIVREV